MPYCDFPPHCLGRFLGHWLPTRRVQFWPSATEIEIESAD